MPDAVVILTDDDVLIAKDSDYDVQLVDLRTPTLLARTDHGLAMDRWRRDIEDQD